MPVEDVLGRAPVEPDPEPDLPSEVARQQRDALEAADPRVAARVRNARRARSAGIAAWNKLRASELEAERGAPHLLPPPVPR